MTEKIDPDRRIYCELCGLAHSPSYAANGVCWYGADSTAPPTNPGGQWDVPEPKSDEPQVFSQGMSSAQYELTKSMIQLVRMVFEHERKFREMERNDKA